MIIFDWGRIENTRVIFYLLLLGCAIKLFYIGIQCINRLLKWQSI